MLTSMNIAMYESKGRQEIRKRKKRTEITETLGKTSIRIIEVRLQTKTLAWILEWIGEIINHSQLLVGELQQWLFRTVVLNKTILSLRYLNCIASSSSLVTMYNAGKSVEGRDIIAVKVSSGGASKPAIFIGILRKILVNLYINYCKMEAYMQESGFLLQQ